MSKLKNILVDGIFYFVCIIAATVLNIAVSWLLTKMVGGVVSNSYFASAVSNIVAYFLTLGVVIGAMAYHEAYKSMYHPMAERSFGVFLAGIMHLAVSVFFVFHPFVSGGVRALAGIINDGKGFSSAERIKEIYLWQYLVAFFIYLAFTMAVLNVCAVIGKNNRKRIIFFFFSIKKYLLCYNSYKE